VKLTPDQLDGLGVALNEATLVGLEVDPQRLVAAATFAVLTLPPDGPEPADRRRQFIFRKKLYVSENQWAGCPERLVRRQLIQRRLDLFFGCDSDGGFFATHR
jgi:hypothetical protein